jgi:hypothetical protein
MDWPFADSGASQHMSDQRWMFTTFHAVKKGSYHVKGIGSENCPLQATGKGDICIKSKVNGEWRNNIIYDVLFVPKLGANSFSVRAATKRGLKVEIRETSSLTLSNRRSHQRYSHWGFNSFWSGRPICIYLLPVAHGIWWSSKMIFLDTLQYLFLSKNQKLLNNSNCLSSV